MHKRLCNTEDLYATEIYMHVITSRKKAASPKLSTTVTPTKSLSGARKQNSQGSAHI